MYQSNVLLVLYLGSFDHDLPYWGVETQKSWVLASFWFYGVSWCSRSSALNSHRNFRAFSCFRNLSDLKGVGNVRNLTILDSFRNVSTLNRYWISSTFNGFRLFSTCHLGILSLVKVIIYTLDLAVVICSCHQMAVFWRAVRSVLLVMCQQNILYKRYFIAILILLDNIRCQLSEWQKEMNTLSTRPWGSSPSISKVGWQLSSNKSSSSLSYGVQEWCRHKTACAWHSSSEGDCSSIDRKSVV